MTGNAGEGGVERGARVSRLAAVIAGILGGGCLGIVSGIAILLAGWAVSPATPPTASPPPPTRTSRPTTTPVAETPAVLLAAEAAWRRGDPQGAIDLLTPALGDLSLVTDRARAYELLGNAEIRLGRSSLAGARFEQAYELEPTVERLYGAALGYDLGGDEDRALDLYLELVAWEGERADPYRDLALARIDHLRLILGTPSPQ
jgi:hypothetical protein